MCSSRLVSCKLLILLTINRSSKIIGPRKLQSSSLDRSLQSPTVLATQLRNRSRKNAAQSKLPTCNAPIPSALAVQLILLLVLLLGLWLTHRIFIAFNCRLQSVQRFDSPANLCIIQLFVCLCNVLMAADKLPVRAQKSRQRRSKRRIR